MIMQQKAAADIILAFEMRGRVVVALVVWSGLVLWGTAYILRCMYGWVLGS